MKVNGDSDTGLAVGPDPDPDALPSIAEQMAVQLGGWRGLLESSIPVVIFVILNVTLPLLRPNSPHLRITLIASVGVALAIAVLRVVQRRPVRHAVNGLFGIGIGAAIAWRTGQAKDFYLPGIWYGYAYGAALLISATARQPLVGWIWSVLVAGGRSQWRGDPLLVRTFTWLTVLWGAVWLAKVAVQHVLYEQEMETALGIARLALGYPPYLLLLAVTVWVVRRVTRQRAAAASELPG